MKIKQFAFRAIAIVIGIVAALICCEVLIRFVSPQPYMYPRYKFSEEYGLLLYPNERMVDALPGLYEFHYTTNEYGYRGKFIAPSDVNNRRNVLVLGDSYSFGKGVNDGEEFPVLLEQFLGPRYAVINLASIGFGLTQEIRTFYEFGEQYKPETIILQFCENDPFDNLINPVTEYRDSQFVFKNTGDVASPRIQAIVSHSRIQTSQLYNFTRLKIIIPIYSWLRGESVGSELKKVNPNESENTQNPGAALTDTTASPEEKYYNILLEAFAKDLKKRGIRLLVISVNGEMDMYHDIAEKVHELNSEGWLEYIEVQPWFAGVTGYDSPEGHVWGVKGHRILAENLAPVVRDERQSGSLFKVKTTMKK